MEDRLNEVALRCAQYQTDMAMLTTTMHQNINQQLQMCMNNCTYFLNGYMQQVTGIMNQMTEDMIFYSSSYVECAPDMPKHDSGVAVMDDITREIKCISVENVDQVESPANMDHVNDMDDMDDVENIVDDACVDVLSPIHVQTSAISNLSHKKTKDDDSQWCVVPRKRCFRYVYSVPEPNIFCGQNMYQVLVHLAPLAPLAVDWDQKEPLAIDSALATTSTSIFRHITNRKHKRKKKRGLHTEEPETNNGSKDIWTYLCYLHFLSTQMTKKFRPFARQIIDILENIPIADKRKVIQFGNDLITRIPYNERLLLDRFEKTNLNTTSFDFLTHLIAQAKHFIDSGNPLILQHFLSQRSMSSMSSNVEFQKNILLESEFWSASAQKFAMIVDPMLRSHQPAMARFWINQQKTSRRLHDVIQTFQQENRGPTCSVNQCVCSRKVCSDRIRMDLINLMFNIDLRVTKEDPANALYCQDNTGPTGPTLLGLGQRPRHKGRRKAPERHGPQHLQIVRHKDIV